MNKKTLTCTVCPRGCEIEAEFGEKGEFSVKGFSCPRGERYARDECLAPKRIFTSSVATDAPGRRRLPVRTRGPVPREKLLACAEEARKMEARGHVRAGDVICRDFLGTGEDLVASMTLQ